jgi:P27 family predicted phage terminase small subunit
MAGGRPRKPDDVKILEGTFQAYRDGNPAEVVVAPGTPLPPASLKGEGLGFWNRVVPGLVELGIAKEADSDQLALMCQWWARHQKLNRILDRMTIAELKRSAVVMTQAAICLDKFDKIACRFGLTPSDRAKLHLKKSETKTGGVMSRDRGAKGA